MTAPVVNHPCEQCGQLDDHPMVHILNGESYHFDCLPHRYVTLLDGPEHAVTRSAIEAAKSGVHGDDLRAHIAVQPSDNELDDQSDNTDSEA